MLSLTRLWFDTHFEPTIGDRLSRPRIPPYRPLHIYVAGPPSERDYIADTEMDSHLTLSLEAARGSLSSDGRAGNSCDKRQSHRELSSSTQAQSGSTRLIRTGCILLAYLCNGLSAGVSTTSSVDLQQFYRVAIDAVTVALGMNLLGQMMGSLMAGPAIRLLSPLADCAMGVFTLLEGLTFAIVPLSSNIIFGGAMMGVRGIIHGINFPICNTVLLVEWGEKAPTSVNAVHLGFSVGYFLAPIFTAQFLSADRFPAVNDSISNKTEFFVKESYENTTDTLQSDSNSESRLIIPFMISGAVGMVSGLIFLLMFIIKKCSAASEIGLSPTRPTSHERPTEPGLSERARKARIATLVCLFLVYLMIPFKDSIVPVFIFYIGVESPLHMSKARAAILNATGGACWVVGRLLTTVLTKRLRIQVILYSVLLIALVLGIFLSIFGLQSEKNLWILSCLFQVFCSPTHACVMTWVDRYISIDGAMMSVIEFSSGVGGFLNLVAGGFILENLGYAFVFYVAAMFTLIVIVLILVLQVIVYKLGDRFIQRTEIIVVDSEEVTEKSPLLS